MRLREPVIDLVGVLVPLAILAVLFLRSI